jgi:hypothetical protein
MKKEWRKKHWNELKQLAGNWIAYDPNGDILFADKDVDIVINKGNLCYYTTPSV